MFVPAVQIISISLSPHHIKESTRGPTHTGEGQGQKSLHPTPHHNTQSSLAFCLWLEREVPPTTSWARGLSQDTLLFSLLLFSCIVRSVCLCFNCYTCALCILQHIHYLHHTFLLVLCLEMVRSIVWKGGEAKRRRGLQICSNVFSSVSHCAQLYST